jgi:hypothetical protein
MRGIKNSQEGISGLNVLICLLIIIMVGLIGWMIYNNHNNAKKTTTGGTANKSKVSSTVNKTPVTSNYLDIKEWGIKIALTSSISDATYHIITNNPNLKPSAFLSTSTLDASAACTAYNQQATSPAVPSYQYIERYNLTDPVSFASGEPDVTATVASQEDARQYRKIGNYVYAYGNENGSPCPEESQIQVVSFMGAFYSIQVD